MQKALNIIHNWCIVNGLTVNPNKVYQEDTG